MFTTIILLGVVVLLVVASGYLSGSEAALFSLSSMQIKSFQKQTNSRWQLVANLLHHPRDLLVTIFMLNTLVNILLQNVISHMVGESAGWSEKVGIPLVLTLIFGEIVPKYIGLQNNTQFSYWTAPAIDWAQRALEPVRKATIAVTTPISKIMFFYLKKEPEISPEELQHVLNTSKKQGVLEAEELELIAGYLHLQEMLVKELMWPREDILLYDVNDPLSKLTYLFVDQQCSRLPVCDQTIDAVLGILTARDFFLHRDQVTQGRDLLPILTKPFYVPETTPARMLFRRFDQQQEELALVVDEYGAITGLIAYEDLVEVVVGEISDLRDQKRLYTRAGKDEIIASGKMELEEFNILFASHLESPAKMVTIGGWLIERLGEIPAPGRKVVLDGFLFHVLAATPSRVRRMYVRKLSSSTNAPEHTLIG